MESNLQQKSNEQHDLMGNQLNEQKRQDISDLNQPEILEISGIEMDGSLLS